MTGKYKCNRCGAPTDNDQSFTITSGYYLEVHRCDECDARLNLEIAWESKGETVAEDELVCPYCQASYDDYDAYGFDEGRTTEIECSFCGRKFDLEVEVRRTYSTKRSLCEMPDGWSEEDE